MPSLLPISKVLVYSDSCPREIVEYLEIVYGFQYHLEFTKPCVQGVITSTYDKKWHKREKWIMKPDDRLGLDTENRNRPWRQFLGNLTLKYQHKPIAVT